MPAVREKQNGVYGAPGNGVWVEQLGLCDPSAFKTRMMIPDILNMVQTANRRGCMTCVIILERTMLGKGNWVTKGLKG